LSSFDFSHATEFELNWNSIFLRKSNSSEYFHVYGGVNDYLDCSNDEFFLKSSLFQKGGRGDSPGQVKFFELLLNGSKNILMFDCPFEVTIDYLRHDKRRSSIPAKPEIFEIPHIYKEDFIKTEHLARLAVFSLVDDKVSHVLKVSSLGNNFINLFKILETIKADEGAKENGFFLIAEEMRELKRFEYTANSPAVIGIYARHGVDEKKFKPAKTLIPMSLSEGHSYVRSIFTRYLKLKYENYPNWD
jgi:hypothetical protein